jgi:hypothetical protein
VANATFQAREIWLISRSNSRSKKIFPLRPSFCGPPSEPEEEVIETAEDFKKIVKIVKGAEKSTVQRWLGRHPEARSPPLQPPPSLNSLVPPSPTSPGTQTQFALRLQPSTPGFLPSSPLPSTQPEVVFAQEHGQTEIFAPGYGRRGFQYPGPPPVASTRLPRTFRVAGHVRDGIPLPIDFQLDDAASADLQAANQREQTLRLKNKDLELRLAQAQCALLQQKVDTLEKKIEWRGKQLSDSDDDDD